MDRRSDDDGIVVEVAADVLVEELLRGQAAVAVVDLVGIGVLEIEGLGRLAVEDAQSIVDLCQHLLAAGRGVLAFADKGAKLQRILAQLTVQDGQVLGRAGGVHRLGITQEGTTPYFLMRLTAISHWPPSGSGFPSRVKVSRSSSSCAAK